MHRAHPHRERDRGKKKKEEERNVSKSHVTHSIQNPDPKISKTSNITYRSNKLVGRGVEAPISARGTATKYLSKPFIRNAHLVPPKLALNPISQTQID